MELLGWPRFPQRAEGKEEEEGEDEGELPPVSLLSRKPARAPLPEPDREGSAGNVDLEALLARLPPEKQPLFMASLEAWAASKGGKPLRMKQVLASIDFGDANLAYCVVSVEAWRRNKAEAIPPLPPGCMRIEMSHLLVTLRLLSWKHLDIRDPLAGTLGEAEAEAGIVFSGHSAMDTAIDFENNGYAAFLVQEFLEHGVTHIVMEQQLGPTDKSPGHPRMWMFQCVMGHLLAKGWSRGVISIRGAMAGWETCVSHSSNLYPPLLPLTLLFSSPGTASSRLLWALP